MTEPTQGQVTFTPTLADTLAAYRLASWRPARAVAIAALCAAVIAAIGLFIPSPPVVQITGAAIGFIGFLAFSALYITLILPWQVRRIHRQQASLRDEYHVTWDETGFRAQTIRADSRMPWQDFIYYRENAATLLLYHSVALFQFLPKRALDEAQIETLRPYLAQIPLKR